MSTALRRCRQWVKLRLRDLRAVSLIMLRHTSIVLSACLAIVTQFSGMPALRSPSKNLSFQAFHSGLSASADWSARIELIRPKMRPSCDADELCV